MKTLAPLLDVVPRNAFNSGAVHIAAEAVRDLVRNIDEQLRQQIHIAFLRPPTGSWNAEQALSEFHAQLLSTLYGLLAAVSCDHNRSLFCRKE
jgi:hypothetical protein